MKTFVSALALGLVLSFSAPAFASTTSGYVGDMIAGKPAPKSPKSAENKTTQHHVRKHAY